MNQRIRAREVRVIVGATGEQLGVLKIQDAIRAAQQRGLDLVEVAPQAIPPVCRIVDFGRYKYEQAKSHTEKKNAASKVKEIKFRVNIDPHDYEIKMRHAEEFLSKGNKVRMALQFRGREMAHKELGLKLMQKVKVDLVTMAHADNEPKLVGRIVAMNMSPLPHAKQKRHFFSKNELLQQDDFHEDELEEQEGEHAE